MSTFACSPKFTVILQEVLAGMQVGAGCWVFTVAMLPISFIVVNAYLNDGELQKLQIMCNLECRNLYVQLHEQKWCITPSTWGSSDGSFCSRSWNNSFSLRSWRPTFFRSDVLWIDFTSWDILHLFLGKRFWTISINNKNSSRVCMCVHDIFKYQHNDWQSTRLTTFLFYGTG